MQRLVCFCSQRDLALRPRRGMKASVATATRYDSVACDEGRFIFPEECASAPLGLSPPEECDLSPYILALAEKYSSKLDISLAKGPCLAASYLALAENKHSYNSLKQVLLIV